MWHETKVMRDNLLRVVAHDAFPDGTSGMREPLPYDFVMGVGGASDTLLTLTPKRRVGRALDIGCGSGIQTLFLNAERIVATDIDERALEAARRSFHLSGFRQIDEVTWREGDRLITLLQGSLFEPVAGQRFDLIVSNPPFVIAGAGHVHRDSPFEGDGLTRALLQALPEHLNPRGIAVMLTTWLQLRGTAWEDRVESWLPDGIGAWVAQREFLNVDEYVQVWGDDAGIAELDRAAWRTRLHELGTEGVGFGWIAVQRSNTAWRRIEDVSNAPRIPDGQELLDQLAAAGAPFSAVDLLQGRWDFATEHWRGDLALDPIGAALVARIRAGECLADAVEGVAAALPADVDDLRILGLTLTLELARLGYLRPKAAPQGI